MQIYAFIKNKKIIPLIAFKCTTWENVSGQLFKKASNLNMQKESFVSNVFREALEVFSIPRSIIWETLS